MVQNAVERSADKPESRQQGRLRSMAAAIVCISVVGFALSLTLPLLSLMLEARGVSDTWIGLNTAVAGVAALIVSPLTAGLARRFGTTRLIYLAILAGCVCLLLLAPAPFWLWFPLRFILSAAITILFVISEFWINAAAPDHKRGLVMGIYSTVLSMGFALGPAVLAIFGSASTVPLGIAIAAFLFAAVPVAFAGPLVPRVEGRANYRLLALLFVAPAATLAAFVYGSGESTMFTFMALWGIRGGLTESTAALLITMAGLGNMLSQIPIGLVADRANKTLALAVCGAFGFIGAALLPATVGTPWLVFTVIFFWGGMAAGLYTVGLTQLGARFSGADLAAANGLFVMLYAVGMLVGPGVGGIALDLWPLYGMPMVIATFFGIYAAFAFVRWWLAPPAASGRPIP
ncbi:MFS transporter [Microbaculum marinisediminis]|uniref:MFS transporter n=1 Tax=Microbaculum marinisediminis TaxID=2931392 RepID=A0AAW5R2V9_9HYPH|nr:MFS transporter [Microbaculum sp. A6E488]MCT8973178.1 MFS transporter [Microbaculum sp. A6E488]